MKRRALIGQWKAFCRWFMFSREQNMDYMSLGGHGRKRLAQELQQTKRCPICHSKPMQCPHSTLDVYTELQTRLVPDERKHKPWPFQHAGRWP